jgi:hypothetical protein
MEADVGFALCPWARVSSTKKRIRGGKGNTHAAPILRQPYKIHFRPL